MKLFVIVIILSLPTFAQESKAVARTDGPKAPVEKSAPLPVTIEIKDADAKLVSEKQKELRLAQLEARNYELEIQAQLVAAQKELEVRQRKAADEQAKWQVMLSGITKIPIAKLDEYVIREEGGKWILTAKTSTPPAK